MVRFGNSKVLSENGVEEVPLAGSPPAKPAKSVKVAPAVRPPPPLCSPLCLHASALCRVLLGKLLAAS